jgi:hypothetical protein
MPLPKPFSLPTSPPGRKHGPVGYDKYQKYKVWLRDEFAFRCAYCLTRELWYPNRHAAFSVDHILPRAKRPELDCRYSNLAYACLRCNSLKRDVVTLHPCNVAIGQHIRFQRNGLVTARTPKGIEFIRLFRLNAPTEIEERVAKLRILRLKTRLPDDPDVDQLYRETFGYPADMPDLESAPGELSYNRRPEGISQCHYARRLRSDLEDVY